MAATVALVAGLGAAAAVLHAGDLRHDPSSQSDRLLYLRSGAAARRLMLSFDSVAADLYWIRTIQHYGSDLKSRRTVGRFELLEPLLDLTTTLDQDFTIAYRFGAIFLALPEPNGPGRADRAIALLEKGLARHPGKWQYALDLGFTHYWFTNDFAKAGQWFAAAAAMPHAPIWIQPLAAATLAQGGDRQGARQLLHNLSASDQSWVRQAAARGLKQIDALDRIDQAQAAVDAFVAVHHAEPRGWPDVVREGLLPGVPIDPVGEPLEFDPSSHLVTLSPRSALGPLPNLRKRP
jgi:hypothetical protein